MGPTQGYFWAVSDDAPQSSRLAVAGAGAAAVVVQDIDRDGRKVARKRFDDAAIGEREAALLRRARRRYGPRLLQASGREIVLEWVEGRTLSSVQADAASPSDRARLAAIVAHAVGRGLAELHELGVRHGDVKPDNILIHDRAPTRDAADDRGATLIDLSLAADIAAALDGATPAYLAPEAQRDPQRAGPETDLYALGMVLHEIVGDDRSAEPARWASALTAPAPGARPSAAWVADRAAAYLDLAEDAAEELASRRESIRRAYLRSRAHDDASADLVVGGGPSDPLARARWLTLLFGAPPPDGIELPASDEALATRLEVLAERRSAFVYADLAGAVDGEREAGTAGWDLVTAAGALARPRPPASALAWAERALATAPSSLALALAEALLRIGEIGRAYFALDRAEASPTAAALGAELARRRGDVTAAAASAERARASGDGVASSRGRATLARLAWDRGALEEAERCLEGGTGPAVDEMRALVAYARGAHERGLAIVAAALAGGPSAEARARLEGVRGMLEHGRGDALASRAAFASAALHAQNGGIIDEATYLTGLAAAAADVGFIDEALTASIRAALLWERFRRPDQAARAWLARASALALVGATHEAQRAADEVIARATAAGDAAALACGHLVHVETRAADDWRARESAVVASRVVPSDDVELAARVDARRLAADGGGTLGPAHVTALDRALVDAAVATRWEWWGARAEAALRGDSFGERRPILAALTALLGTKAPVASRAPALRAAGALARSLGDGEAVRRIDAVRREIVSVVREHTPPEYRARLETMPWIAGLEEAGSATSGLEPAQIAVLEGLVRSLGARDRLAPLLNQVLDALLLWTGVERGLLLVRAPDGALVPRAARNIARTDLAGDQRELSLGIARRALEIGDVVVATDAFATLGELHASVHALRLRSVLAVPLVARGEPLGVVYLDDRLRRGAFGEREIAWVRLLSTHAALAIADARDVVRLRRAVRHAERARGRLTRDLEARELELDRAKAALAEDKPAVHYDGIAGRSEAMQRTLHVVARVSSSDVPVLLAGESGSGKELLARAIHQTGRRRGKPFVTENCGAVPEPLLESILFGHKKGAFTGATSSRAGLFEVADGGTFFLDEIGEMSPAMQAKLLRVLQDGEIRAVGGEQTRHVDVRIVAATHRDLEGMVKAGSFREDLFYRLNVVRIDVPPLRDRMEDIPLLVAHFLEKHAPDRPIRVTRAAIDRLVAYPWPGNVRQLENEVRRAIVLAGDRIDAAELSPEILRSAQSRKASGADLRSRLDALEAELVQEALDKTRGNQTKAAEILGVSRFGLQKMIKRLGLRTPS